MNNPAKFHPDPIWNDGALGFFEERPRNKNKRMSCDMGSVPDTKAIDADAAVGFFLTCLIFGAQDPLGGDS